MMELGMQVNVSPWLFRIVWCTTALCYCFCTCFLVFQAAVYFSIPVMAVPLLGNLELYSIGINRVYYPPVGSIFIAIAAVHIMSLLEMLYTSLRHRRLMFTATSARASFTKPRSFLMASLQRMAASIEPILPPPTSRLRRLTSFLGVSLLSVWRAFGVTSPNYGVVYVIRELIQTAIQTNQAYRLSALVAREWMNRVIVGLLVLNCWATPLIQFLLRSSPAATRLLCLLVNLALDIVTNIVFPVALFLPYYADFDAKAGNFPIPLWYTDVWLIQVVNEWQLLFVSSFWDALSKYFIAYNITRTLRSTPQLLRCRDNAVGVQSLGPQVPLAPNVHTFSNSAAIVPTPATVVSDADSKGVSCVASSRLPTATRRVKWRHRIEHWGHRLLALWGLAVCAFHIQSTLTGDNDQCLVQVRPWFTTRPVCSLMEITCYDGKRTGNAADFDRAIETIQREWLAYLIIRHCDAVEITPRIQELPWLIALKVYNSTLHRWDHDAALTQTHHPLLLSVTMAVIQAEAIPQGLYDRDFPLKLYDIELTQWNVTSLPDEIAEIWPAGMFLVIEEFQFPSFPTALAKLRPGYISISYNNFTEIPSLFWENEELALLNANGNPITSLPITPGISPVYVFISIVETQVAQVPAWINAETVLEFRGGNIPLCANLKDNNVTALGVTDAEMATLQHLVNCTPAKLYHYLTHYPLTYEATNNPSRVH